jgi:membrane protein
MKLVLPVATRPLPSEAGDAAPRTGGRSRVQIVRAAVANASRDHVTSIAAALAYYAFLAIPSVLLVAVGVFGLVAGPDTVNALVDKLGTIMPREATDLVSQSLNRLTQHSASATALVGIGGALAIWSIGSAMQNVMWALNTVFGREETRGFVRRRLAAWAMAFFALIGFSLALGLLVLGSALSGWLGNALNENGLVSAMWWSAQWPVLMLGLFLAYAGILYLGPNVEGRRWRLVSFGSIVAVAVWLLASGAFAFYVSQFGSYNKTWGVLAAVVVLLTWLWLSAVALLLGAEIEAEAEGRRGLRPAERGRSV